MLIYQAGKSRAEIKPQASMKILFAQSCLEHNLKATMNTGYQVQVSGDAHDAEWNAFLAKIPDGHHVQITLWAQVKALLGWRAVRLIVSQDGQIVAGAQLLIRSLPLVGPIGYVTKGPVFSSLDPILLNLVAKELLQVVKAQSLRGLIVQPSNNGEALAQQLPSWGFRPSPIEVAPSATIQIDLTKDLDEILAQMKKATRKHIHRGPGEGITVREGADSDLDTFYRLLVTTSQRQQFSLYPKEYFAKMWRLFTRMAMSNCFLPSMRVKLWPLIGLSHSEICCYPNLVAGLVVTEVTNPMKYWSGR
jgi:hypothetical protein